MKTMMLAGVLLAATTAASAAAPSPFDGTWKTDLKASQFSKKPDVFVVQNGTFDCKTCIPELKIPADGAFHKVIGHPYYDEASFKIIDAHTVTESQKLKGKAMGTSTTTVSPDGATASYTFTDTSAANGVPVTGKGTQKRIAKGPPGSHALSGSWQDETVSDVSDAGMTMSFKTEGNLFHLSTATGQSYAATFGGPAVPIKGDQAMTMAAVKKVGEKIIETDTRGGKVVTVYTTSVSPDGKKMTVAIDDPEHGKKSVMMMVKQ